MNTRVLVAASLTAGLCFGAAVPRESSAAPPKYTFKSLGTLGGATSTAEGLNDAGDVVGDSDMVGGTTSPYVYTAAHGMQNLNVVTYGPIDGPAQSVFGPDITGDGKADLYMVCMGFYGNQGSSVVVCDGATGKFVGSFILPDPAGTNGGLSAAAYILIGPEGDFYISSSPIGSTMTNDRNRVARFDGATGVWLGDFVSAGSGGLLGATGMAFGTDIGGFDANGNQTGPDGEPDFFVASNQTNNVLAYDGFSGAFLGVFVTPGNGLNGVGGVHFVPDLTGDGAPDLLVVSRTNAAVLLYDGLTGNFIKTFVAPVSGYAFNSMTIGPDGDLYLPAKDPTNTVFPADLVLRFDGKTGASKGIFVASGSGGLNGPSFFATFDSNNSLYVNSNNSNQILKYQGPYGTSPGAFVQIFVTGVGFTLINAIDINNLGQIVGSGHPIGRHFPHGVGDTSVAAYRYTPPAPGEDVGSAIDLQLPGNTDEEAVAINDSGDVAGYFLSPSDNHYHAFLWSASTGKAVDLGMLSGLNTFATAITNRTNGQVQVSGYASGGRAWRYNTATGNMQNLGVFSGSGTSTAWDIIDSGTNAGTAVGYAASGSYQRAFVRTLTGSMTDLGTLGGNNSYAFGVNASRTVVGTADTNTKSSLNQHQAFMSTTVLGMFKLEPQITNLPASMQLKIRPTRINTGGTICGPDTYESIQTPSVAYVLIPQ